MSVNAGDIIYASVWNDAQPRVKTKPSATPRNTTTTLTNDPHLQGITLTPGTYEIEFIGFVTFDTTTTQKFKGRWGFTGSWNNPNRVVIGPGQAQTAAPANATETNFAGAQASGQDVVVSSASTVIWTDWREISFTVVVTATGDLSYQWAQNSSSANNTTLQAESGFRIRKIS